MGEKLSCMESRVVPDLFLPLRLIEQETRALLSRLASVKPFVLYETMVPAAGVSMAAQNAIEGYLYRNRINLREKAHRFLGWLHSGQVNHLPASELQRRFTLLRMQFNISMSQFDIFADVMTQRSEYQTGVWLAGLDAIAADALSFPGEPYIHPPVVCYLDRGHGAAIRRARTRLPGGGDNPVAVIRVPRERMVGSGIASSLVHEVGHQGAALLKLVDSMRPLLRGLASGQNESHKVWLIWERWISEILSDLWAVSRVGIAAPLGLMGVVSLPRPFVFRVSLDDPHPVPWIRVKLSCAMGAALYPHPQWGVLARLWEAYYPLSGIPAEKQRILRWIEDSIPSFVSVLINHRPRKLRGESLRDVMALHDRAPACLQSTFTRWKEQPALMRTAPPTLAFAALEQARSDGLLGPEKESQILSDLLMYWAVRKAMLATETRTKSCVPVLRQSQQEEYIDQ